MNRQELEKTVTAAIADVLGCDQVDIAQSSKIDEDLGADSIDAVEILMLVEDGLEIEFADGEIYNLKEQGPITVKAVCDLAERYLNM